MRWKPLIGAAALVGVVVVLGAWLTKFSLDEMMFLAPIAVVVAGAVAGLVVLWAKVIAESVRSRRH